MKHFKYLLIGAVSVVCFITLWSGISHAVNSIRFSKHDLSSSGGGNFSFETIQVCVFCHTPHGANTDARPQVLFDINNPSAGYQNTGSAAGNAPMLLWNRAFSNAVEMGVYYEAYQSSTMNANNTTIRIYSILCLSCHDGVGAINVLTKLPRDATTETGRSYAIQPNPSNSANQIGDLQYTGDINPNIGNRTSPTNTLGYGGEIPVQLFNDHPISFDYDDTLAGDDGGLMPPGGISPLRLFPNPSGTPGVSLECPTCHNVHDQGGNENSDQFPFLVMSNAGSALCLKCHNK